MDLERIVLLLKNLSQVLEDQVETWKLDSAAVMIGEWVNENPSYKMFFGLENNECAGVRSERS